MSRRGYVRCFSAVSDCIWWRAKDCRTGSPRPWKPPGEKAPNLTAAAFRTFAEQTKSDLKALAACMRGSRKTLSREEVSQIEAPTLVTVGTLDTVAGSAPALAALMPNARSLELPNRDHSTAVGDKQHRQGVLAFLDGRP